jgi:hypothetical protein
MEAVQSVGLVLLVFVRMVLLIFEATAAITLRWAAGPLRA